MDGILNINKPPGPTSFAIVAQLRRLIKEKRIGHGGTLDPLASGVLPLFLGRATRLVEYLHEYPKTYLANITLGIATDTYDAEGRVVATVDVARITREAIIQALSQFEGVITQTPPSYSAIKRHGQPLYALARKGLVLEANPRQVTISRLAIVDFQPPLLTLEIECGTGTYIRSLANDLGRELGVGAHLANLVRTSYGPFCINDAVSPSQMAVAAEQGKVSAFMQPPDVVLASWLAVTLTEEQEKIIGFGQQLSIEAGEAKRLRAYGHDGRLIALLVLDDMAGAWKPSKVFSTCS